MTSSTSHPTASAGLLTAGALLILLTGCVAEGSGRHTGYRSRSVAQVQTVVVFEDDYDYYPGYEVYYSRNRKEYVYRDGGQWVRRSQPSGVSLNILLAAPSVRVDFRDSPERHHAEVVRAYPRSWRRSDNQHDDRSERKSDKNRKNRKNDDKNDKRHDRD